MKIPIVIKIGGGLLTSADAYTRVTQTLSSAKQRDVLVVPGGGLFADSVRTAAQRFDIDDSTAHWMAIGAMDQFGMMLAGHITRSTLVGDPHEAEDAIARATLPIIAPYRWLRCVDPLPHSWDVTSDSIAAWIAIQVRADSLILVKPPAATGRVVDPYFPRARGDTIRVTVVTADQLAPLAALLT